MAWKLFEVLRAVRPALVYEREIPSLWPCFLCLGVPLFLEINGDAVAESLSYRRPRFGVALAYLRFKLWAKYRLARGLLPVAEFLRARVPPGRPVLVTRCGYHAAAVQVAPSARIVLGFLGSFRRWHRLDLLVAAFARCARPDLFLLLVGDGPERAATEAYLERHCPAESFRFDGQQPDPSSALALMDYGFNFVTMGLNDPLSNSKVKSYLCAGVQVIGNHVLSDGATLAFRAAPTNETVAGLTATLEKLVKPSLADRQVLSAAAAARFDWTATMRERWEFIQGLRGSA